MSKKRKRKGEYYSSGDWGMRCKKGNKCTLPLRIVASTSRKLLRSCEQWCLLNSVTLSSDIIRCQYALRSSFLCSINSGESLFNTNVWVDGISMACICHPNEDFMIVYKVSNSENRFQILHLYTISF